jgi:hypothetical protein
MKAAKLVLHVWMNIKKTVERSETGFFNEPPPSMISEAHPATPTTKGG